MSDFNINASNTRTSGDVQTNETEKTAQQQTIGASKTDTIGQQEKLPDTLIPKNSNTPNLVEPNYAQANQANAQKQESDPAVAEQKVRNAIESNPELAEAVDLILNKKGKNSSEGRAELLSQILRYIQQKKGETGAQGAKEAVASQLQELIGKSSPKEAKQLQEALDGIRTGLVAKRNPEFQVLVNTLKKQLIKEGKSPEQAEKLAQEQALKSYDGYLSSKGVSSPAIGAHPSSSAAVQSALKNALPDKLNSLEKDGFAGGVTLAASLEQGLYTQFETIAAIKPAATDPLQKTKEQGAASTEALEEIIKELEKNLPHLPLNKQQRLELVAYLKFLSEAIKEIKDVLNKIAIGDSKKSKDLARQKLEQADARYKARMDKLEKQLKAMLKKNVLGPLLKGLGYAIGAIVTIAGALLAPVTGGASLAIAIGVSIALFAATTALSETGVMNKAFEQLGGLLDKAFDKLCKSFGVENPPGWAKSVFKVLVYVAIIAAAVVLTRGAAANMSSPLAQVLAIQIGVSVTTQMIASSGVVTDFVDVTLSHIPGVDEEVKQWVAAILLIIVLLTVSLVAASSISNIAKGAKDSAKQFGDDIAAKLVKLGINPKRINPEKLANAAHIVRRGALYTSAIGQGAQAAPSIAKGVMDMQIAKLKKEEAEFKALIETISELIKLLQKTIDVLLGDAQDTHEQAGELTELFDKAVSGQSEAMNNLSNAQTA